METRYEVIGEYHVAVVADDHDDAPDPAKPWQAVAQITRLDTGVQIASVPASAWYGTREKAVAAAHSAGVSRAGALPKGLQGEEAGSPEPD